MTLSPFFWANIGTSWTAAHVACELTCRTHDTWTTTNKQFGNIKFKSVLCIYLLGCFHLSDCHWVEFLPFVRLQNGWMDDQMYDSGQDVGTVKFYPFRKSWKTGEVKIRVASRCWISKVRLWRNSGMEVTHSHPSLPQLPPCCVERSRYYLHQH